MKNHAINLHMDRKRALAMMLFFALVFSAILIFVAVSVRNECANINSLLRSGYEYSVVVEEPIQQDDYYQFNAGIVFTASSDASKGLNADILMQSADSTYTESVDWNTHTLGSSAVAITEGLAKAHNLSVGDKVFSKHIVDGTVHEYIIEGILPELTSLRDAGTGSFRSGLIIMGYDSSYAENISYQIIVFTDAPIEVIDSQVAGTPQKIVYRSDEISASVNGIIPYLLSFAAIAVIAAIALVYVQTRWVKYNFRRLATAGFEKKLMDRSYSRLVIEVGIPPILIAFLISIAVSQLLVFSLIEALFLVIICLAGVIAIIASSGYFKRRLWR